MSSRARRTGAVSLVAAIAAVLVLALSGCSKVDESEIVTFTDEHGRACTAVAVKDAEDGGFELRSIDCDYPPEGRTPGPATHKEVPRS